MRPLLLVLAAILASTGAAVPAPSPQEAWKAWIADANEAYAKRKHAILKIQDAAYLREGSNVTLVGNLGDPKSYHWVKGMTGKGVLFAGVRNGHPFVVKDKHIYADPDLAKGIQVDVGVDIAGSQTQVAAGVVGARIWVYNQDHPAAASFTGLSYFPYDPAYIVTATFVPDAKRASRVFRTSRGTDKQFFHAGDAHFSLHGKTVTLPFFSDSNVPAKMTVLSAFFTDDMTGKMTYGAGRYVDIDHFGAFPPKQFKIDFNYAYNPNCARSAYFTCPIALDNIPTAIRAGELDPHMPH